MHSTDSVNATLIHDILNCNISSTQRALFLGQLLRGSDGSGLSSFDCPPENNTSSNSGENYAVGWTASASSYFSGNGPSSAVDGNKNCNWAAGSISHTKDEMNPWWMVDMGRQVCVRRVVIYNRSDCCGELLRHFTVSVSQTQDGNREICSRFPRASITGATEFITCSKPIYGRFVKIQIAGWGHLALCEVEVF